jgi:hypothetical protein
MMPLSPSTTLWALSLRRTGETQKATAKLLEMMSQNVCLLPILIWEPPDSYHISGMAQTWSSQITSHKPHPAPCLNCRSGSALALRNSSTVRFRRAREEYVATYRALKYEKNVDNRRQGLRRWNEFLAQSVTIDG